MMVGGGLCKKLLWQSLYEAPASAGITLFFCKREENKPTQSETHLYLKYVVIVWRGLQVC